MDNLPPNQNAGGKYLRPRQQGISNAKQMTGDTRHKITFTEAMEFVYEFNLQYQPVGIKDVGGYIPKKELEDKIFPKIKLTDIKEGPLFWFGYNMSLGDYKQFFLSWTYDKDFDPTDPYTEPKEMVKHYISSQIYTDTVPLDLGGYLNYMKFIPHIDPAPDQTIKYPLKMIPTSLVKFFAESFRNNFPLAADGLDYIPPYNCGLFIKSGIGINDLIKQPGVIGLNYYFGINTKQDKRTICVVLIAVDENGLNVLGDTALLLERAWP